MGEGEVTVGRDANAVWVIDDPDRRLSRFHCTISARHKQIFVRDTSANGVYIGADCERMERSVEMKVPDGETLHLGQYVLVVDADSNAEDEQVDPTGSSAKGAPLHDSAGAASTNAIPDHWAGPEPHPQPQTEKGDPAGEVVMLEAFCQGAELDPSYLTSEDAAEVMHRLGEIYRQVVLGLGDLMSERASVKTEYSLDRTTIGATANNPLKWAPTHRLAVDLLCERTGGFLKGADAVRECFEDLKAHSLCLVAGSREVVSELLEQFDPKTIDAQVKTSLFMERSEASWRQMKSLHANVSSNPFNDADSAVNRAFKRGYERCANDLNVREPGE
ncbi:type VI secretion system-associated FHA domain protein TagH [Henriciella sp.]|uniref:type VI secretion system-associated FHA domain protein TagH n=1 Tax=Henriciella sp. TaxID=1968823 RepID=UPI00260236CF|nr:type VI secretion system-associated FHA domain protein TagH [Henriciella sp.]